MLDPESLLLDPELPESLVLESLVTVSSAFCAASAACAANPIPTDPTSPAATNAPVSNEVRRIPVSRFIPLPLPLVDYSTNPAHLPYR